MANQTAPSFQKLYDYIKSRKEVDNTQTEQIEQLDKKIDDTEVNFNVYYDLLTITKGHQS